MSLDVSSFFRSNMESTVPSSLYMKFTFNNSDISNKVVDYGTITRNVDDVVAGDFTVDVTNADQTFNSLLSNKLQFTQEGQLEYGFCHAANSYETISLFKGNLVDANYNGTLVTLVFEDSFRLFGGKEVGTSNSGGNISIASNNPADLAWTLISSYGEMSDVKSTSNPDLDYTTWLAWWNVFDNDTVFVGANFTGQSIIEALETLKTLTDSSIYILGDGKLYFSRWSGMVSNSLTTVDMSNSYYVGDPDLEATTKQIINEISVNMDYNVSSGEWEGGVVTFQNTDSVNSYGLNSLTYDDTMIWFVNSVSALNLAQRVAYRRAEPNIITTLTTPFRFLDLTPGDEVLFTTPIFSFNEKNLLSTNVEIDIESKSMELTLDEGYGQGMGRLAGFVLDDAYWGLLDEDYNRLY